MTSKDPRAGQVLGELRLEEELGRGGNGSVHRARPIGGGFPVAVKILHHSDEMERHTGRLQREVGAARRLEHPNAVRIFGYGEDSESRPYLVMELLEGETLRARLRREGALPPIEAVRIVREILPVLVEAHAAGLIHRDLKPENIFLTSTPRGGVKVLDFGLVKVLEGTDSFGRLTRTGMIGGTPRYVSPENAEGKKLDARSDLYSLGIILFELLSGQAPFRADAAIDQLLQHIQDPVPALFSPFGALPVDLIACVYKCLEKRPRRRPESARVVLQQLAALTFPAAFSEGAGRVEATSGSGAPLTVSDEQPPSGSRHREEEVAPAERLSDASTEDMSHTVARRAVNAIGLGWVLAGVLGIITAIVWALW